jgi:acylphosphatase
MPTDVRQIRVVGRVQGVGFRWFVRELARSLDLAGWVRNESDGAVLLVAAGASDALAKLEAAVRVGPHGARVEHVDVTNRSVNEHELSRPFAVVRAGFDT